MSYVHEVWPKPFCKVHWKGEEDKADRGRGGKATLGNGQALNSPNPRGQWRTRKKGRKLVAKITCGVPTTLAVKRLMMMMMMSIRNYCLIWPLLFFQFIFWSHLLLGKPFSRMKQRFPQFKVVFVAYRTACPNQFRIGISVCFNEILHNAKWQTLNETVG